jgi:hypothetical protein
MRNEVKLYPDPGAPSVLLKKKLLILDCYLGNGVLGVKINVKGNFASSLIS